MTDAVAEENDTVCALSIFFGQTLRCEIEKVTTLLKKARVYCITGIYVSRKDPECQRPVHDVRHMSDFFHATGHMTHL